MKAFSPMDNYTINRWCIKGVERSINLHSVCLLTMSFDVLEMQIAQHQLRNLAKNTPDIAPTVTQKLQIFLHSRLRYTI